jgi:hypothetical protein
MNERIRELAEQIVCFEQDMDGSMEPNEDGQWIRVDELEKFAELLIKECHETIKKDMELAQIQLLPLDFGMYANGRLRRIIKEHFGVE